jgi:pyrroline-5-carboxylate reductase
MASKARIAILGTGNIGRAIATGLVASGAFDRSDLILTRRNLAPLKDLAEDGYRVTTNNHEAVQNADCVLVAVEPKQLDGVLREIAPDLDAQRHLLISVVSGASISDIGRQIDGEVPVVRAMPNTAVALGQSMTCLATHCDRPEVLEQAVKIFQTVGTTMVIDESKMVPATALCACGIAFFLRAVRAASQGGIEIGFHPEQALAMAAQTALGAASLVLQRERHPEREIDAVTTPRGCTITGLNEMEHAGFSSALIKGITLSAEKAASLYESESD